MNKNELEMSNQNTTEAETVSELNPLLCTRRRVFNFRKWMKNGGDTETNEEFWESAKIIAARIGKYDEILVDVIFDSGEKSTNHFYSGTMECT